MHKFHCPPGGLYVPRKQTKQNAIEEDTPQTEHSFAESVSPDTQRTPQSLGVVSGRRLLPKEHFVSLRNSGVNH
jgi:hypothetical protein